MWPTSELLASLLGKLRLLTLFLRLSTVVGLMALALGCATNPPSSLQSLPTFEVKIGWILSLEDQRILRDMSASPTSIDIDTITDSPAELLTGFKPDLVKLLVDVDPRIRRRAALAIGRVGRLEGVDPLTESLSDSEVEVRQMSAFSLGLIGDPIASVALVQSLSDPSPLVQGRAAEALGRLGAIEAAPAIGEVVTRHITSAFEVHPEDLSYPQSQEVEAFRLGIYALSELQSFEVLAGAVLRDNGQPILWWWPVAYALQRIEDPRALTSLIALTGVQGTIGVALAAQGLGVLGNPAAVDALVNLLDRNLRDDRVVATAVRALGRIEGTAATEALRSFVLIRDLKPILRLEAVQALSGRLGLDATPIFAELMTHRWPDMRAAAVRALAQADSETFMLVLSGLEPDPNWRVRAATAQALGYVSSASTHSRLMEMFGDQDQRVLPSVLSALVAIEAPDIQSILMMALQRDDVVVRKAASQLLAILKPSGFEEALTNAYRAAAKDASYLARASILEALVKSDGLTKREVLREGLSDPEWSVRLRAADLLSKLETGDDHAATIRPAPRRGEVSYTAEHLVNPRVSPHIYLETERGTIQIELAVLDAPQTTENFVGLARAGYYDGLTFHRVIRNYVAQGGDPRGDSEGGPGYTLRDELNQLPFLRGTVAMALDWQDTGGSQFFITQSPQPQLDGRYTVFGKVIAGMDVVDQLLQGDVIDRVLVWDGTEPVTR